ncbi:MAG: FAD-dependent oxidoreductase [Rhodocyclaceae bacterium]|jgi:rubredoxin-NAD+ reductase|nr:FAD-dependent oxidoreductase [Rhodocyclaceae bacterium]
MIAPIVIVGSGLAGVTLARELRKLDTAVPVVLIAADTADFYSKPMLSNGLASGKTPAQLVSAPREALAAQLGIEIRAGVTVDAIVPTARRIETSAGPVSYAQLVLALGAQPIRLPIDGDGAGEVLSVNTLADYARWRDRLLGARHVALLGAGLIGCEFANDLSAAGIGVDVYDIAPQPLGRLLPPGAAAAFRTALEGAGIAFHFGVGIARVERMGQGYRITDSSGSVRKADLVLSAVGLRPKTALAQGAGLRVGRGIGVDRLLATSAADIYALGDCAEVEGHLLPFVMPIMQQARALAKTLAGTPTAVHYPAMPVVVKTPACPTVVCPPPPGSVGEWREEACIDGVRAIFADRTGKTLGFALVGAIAAKERQTWARQVPPLLAA